MKKLYKILGLLILILNFNQFTNAKPLPPGSGSGNVPANILILLDTSESMENSIGEGLPLINSATINGDGNRVLVSNDASDGGLYLVNSSGEFINFSGTKDNGDSYTTRNWFPRDNTDRTCDYALWDGGTAKNVTIDDSKKLHRVKYVTGVSVKDTNITSENLLFVGQYQASARKATIFALDSQYRCRLAIYPSATSNGNSHWLRGFDVSKNVAGQIIVAGFGRYNKGEKKTEKKYGYQITCNLNEGKCAKAADLGGDDTNVFGKIYKGLRYRLNSDSTDMYISQGNALHGYRTKEVNGVPVITNSRFRFCQGISNPTGTKVVGIDVFDISTSDDLMYVAGKHHKVQRVEWTSNTCAATVTAGTESTSSNKDETAGALNAADIRITKNISALNVSDGKILFSHNGYVDELTESRFTTTDKDIAWQIQYGGVLDSRLEGAVNAIKAILSDNTLTSGANFGFGYWNAGELGNDDNATPSKGGGKGGTYCHKNSTSCDYFGGWNETRKRSQVCTQNSCLKVAVSPEGANQTLGVLGDLETSFGTDAEAFSQIARDYFFSNGSPHDPNSDCQLNYVIVIGDGLVVKSGTDSNNNIGRTAGRLRELRTQKGVKTLFVAYGDGIRPDGKLLFDEMAVAGSCDAAGGADCEPTIVASTPLELQTTLNQKIRQILAERLAFTAPSITATIQEGGSLYQAQFAYEQYGEWQGTILRKTLNADGTVNHDVNSPGNWDAAEQVKIQSAGGPADPNNSDSRKIWTVFDGGEKDYIESGWDNLKEESATFLETEMERLGYVLTNYHTSSSACPGDDTTDDELKGILRFLAGQDFFDYNGDCDTTQLRDHVLGDIYHSQLIEVGAPDGNTQFTDNNQEAYFRSINNYQAFKNSYSNRRNILYAGSNSGLLHAFNAETGREEWAFLPPLLIGKLPTIINSSLDGNIDGSKGGSNAIFGVDGSPVVHDVFMKGLTRDGNIENDKSWHTILIVPFGRGGPGFSVLDITNQIGDGLGPMHMFTVYNDSINNVVYIADYQGEIFEEEYFSGSASISSSREATKAKENYNSLIAADGGSSSETTTNQDANALCQSNTDASGDFTTNGTSSCYIGRTFTFNDIILGAEDIPFDSSMISVTEVVNGGDHVPVTFSDARMGSDGLVITFNDDKIFNAGASLNEIRITNNISVQTNCTAKTTFTGPDYSKLAETWSTPRVVRLPSDIAGEETNIENDKYVAIMGGGMGNNRCAGSALFLVELDDLENPGKIYGSEANGGPITIIDTSPSGVSSGNNIISTPNGSDISNAIPTSPLVITPDTAFGIPWRGAMVYINDREGKITKINLTDSTINDAELFDQTTLFRLDANTINKRYSFFSMDAGVGASTKDFWLFGGTGDFNRLGDKSEFMDNILYGVRDFDYPYFKHLNGVIVPSSNDESFASIAHQGANNAKSIDGTTALPVNADACLDVTGDIEGLSCPDTESAWVIHLDPEVDSNSYRKVSAPPTLFKGKVYFPVYEPAPGDNACNIGNAYICAADDECGTNNSHKLVEGSKLNESECLFIRQGVLSELVVFGGRLFANVAGPNQNESTLFSILGLAGEVLSNKGGWRDVGF